MQPQSRTFLYIGAGLLGVLVGQRLRQLVRSPGHRSADEFAGLAAPALTAAPALADMAGSAFGLDEDALAERAAVTFGLGASLALLADTIGARLPGVLAFTPNDELTDLGGEPSGPAPSSAADPRGLAAAFGRGGRRTAASAAEE
ncbi:MAG: hypothetical protein ACK2T6_06490 [Anaerolineae bacterium]|jgi:hypothetical protein